MASNLDKMFKSDSSLEKEGVFFEIAEGIRFKVRRFGGSNSEVKKAMVKYYKPHARLIERNLLPESKEREIYQKAFIDACLVSWEGVELDGELVEYSKEAAFRLFQELPELFETLVEHSQTVDHYREDLGN
jgi:hypothetical protein